MRGHLAEIDPAAAGARWVRFGHLVERSRDADRADLDPLSVFLDGGVVPRADREGDNHNRLGADMDKYLHVRPGDLVFNKLRTWQGGFGASQFEGVVSPAYFVCRPTSALDPRYADYLLHSQPYLRELTRVSKWMPPSQFDIAWDDLKSLPVLAPPVATQRRIAAFLDDETERIDQLIATKTLMIELVEERAHRASERLIVEAAERFGALKLKYAVDDVTVGIVVQPAQWYVDSGILALRGVNVSPGSISVSDVVFLSDEGHEAHSKSELRSGDVVVVRTGDAGAAAVVPPHLDGANCIDLLLIRPGEYSPELLAHTINVRRTSGAVADASVGSIQSHFNVGALREIPLPNAGPAEQQRLAAEIDAVQSWSADVSQTLRQQIDLLRQRRRSLITAAVAGEMEVP